MMRPGLTPTPGKFCTEGPHSLPVTRPAKVPGVMPGRPDRYVWWRETCLKKLYVIQFI
jgi:hypothetical protein